MTYLTIKGDPPFTAEIDFEPIDTYDNPDGEGQVWIIQWKGKALDLRYSPTPWEIFIVLEDENHLPESYYSGDFNFQTDLSEECKWLVFSFYMAEMELLGITEIGADERNVNKYVQMATDLFKLFAPR